MQTEPCLKPQKENNKNCNNKKHLHHPTVADDNNESNNSLDRDGAKQAGIFAKSAERRNRRSRELYFPWLTNHHPHENYLMIAASIRSANQRFTDAAYL